ncbi:hypothetical protein Csa_010464 [Cucumis sativus]|nr:hypothetical protein Csa_010464 [Cucumis sativus]
MLELPAFPQKVASKYGCIELNHRSSISAPTIQITFPKQGKSSFWVHKNSKVIKEGFRGCQVLLDGGESPNMLKLEWAFLSSKYSKPGFSRNPFEVLMEKEASWALDPSHVCQTPSSSFKVAGETQIDQ